jgi:NADH:ubiquinone oxidoreductase subunit 3 (subunit A)
MVSDMSAHTFLFWPPVALVLVLLATLGFSWLFSLLSLRPRTHASDEGEPYACGEEQYNHTARPDYSIFFPFAFFFTIAHVAALIITTVPAASPRVLALAALYIGGSVTGLYILMRKE